MKSLCISIKLLSQKVNSGNSFFWGTSQPVGKIFLCGLKAIQVSFANYFFDHVFISVDYY